MFGETQVVRKITSPVLQHGSKSVMTCLELKEIQKLNAKVFMLIILEIFFILKFYTPLIHYQIVYS